MMLLVSGAHATIRRYRHPQLGWLLTPRGGARIGTILDAGVAWAADNDAYIRFDEAAYRRMLERIAAADTSRLLFVTAPDVVANAASTLALFAQWQPVLAFGDYTPGRWAWKIEDVELLPEPVPARGALGLWAWTPPGKEQG